MEEKEVEAIELAINLILEAVDELQTIKSLAELKAEFVGDDCVGHKQSSK